MKKISLALIVLILVGICVPAVSAESIIDQAIEYNIDTTTIDTNDNPAAGTQLSNDFSQILLPNIETRGYVSYIAATLQGNAKPPTMDIDSENDLTYTIDGVSNPCRVYYTYQRNFLGIITATNVLIFFDDWDVDGLAGTKIITFSKPIIKGYGTGGSVVTNFPNGYIYRPYGSAPNLPEALHTMIVVSSTEFKNYLSVNLIDNSYEISLTREYESINYPSTIQLIKDDTTVFYNEDNKNLWIIYRQELIDSVRVISPNFDNVWQLTPLTTSEGVTVYVQNSQTGALIANSHIDISAFVNGEFHEVVNETLPGGIYTGNLQPTGGGLPNPDYYRLIATAEGYNSIMPYIDFEHGSATTLIVEMEPMTGGPADDNMTFIEFYVRDIYTNPISGASVTCGGYTLITNSAGYTQFEMPVNSAYSYKVSKTGYLTIEGIATVESDDRYVVNVALMAGVVPTQTVVTPTITVEPTPTQTTPPIQEDNLIGLSVKGLAKGFGIDYDTALLMFGLMIIFGAGGMVMSSVKGGAMEFIAGSIVGTFVAFALGLIPIWIFIIIAVVFGAYVLRVFVQGSQ